jgi:hypothetical protein
VENYCYGKELISENSLDTTYYELIDSLLYIWHERDCAKIILKGYSSTVVGTWTTDFDTVAIDNPDCNNEDNILSMTNFMTTKSGKVIITDSSIAYKIDGDVCFAPAMAEQIKYGVLSEDNQSGVSFSQIIPVGCSYLSYVQDEGMVNMMEVNHTILDDSTMRTSVTIDSCTSTIIIKGSPFVDPETCDDQELFTEEFMQCYLNDVTTD